MTSTRPEASIRIAEPDEDFPGIIALYHAHGWTHANDPGRLRTAIRSSAFNAVAEADGRIVGFARAMSDQAFAVYIADILVAPDRQREGIGRRLVASILDHYPPRTFHHQVLIAERGAEGFYRRLGLVPVSAYGLTAFIRSP
ncbi:MAG TPA: GNAT family N-acetyltransferase [Miltoncostaeaceae bacterium]|nr:GNAT family N-acetyltransferase [Miltoncostaeaceae bacterium]